MVFMKEVMLIVAASQARVQGSVGDVCRCIPAVSLVIAHCVSSVSHQPKCSSESPAMVLRGMMKIAESSERCAVEESVSID